jgi:Tol biopolymer transport system component
MASRKEIKPMRTRATETIRPAPRGILVALFFALGAAACGTSQSGAATTARRGSPSDSASTSATGHIVYGRFDPEGVALFTANADGTGTMPLLPGSGAEQPHWSPDGTKLAIAGFDRVVVGGVVNADGTGYHLFDSPDATLNLACVVWSPDSTRLACEGFDEAHPTRNGVYTVRATDGGDLQRVTTHRDIPCAYSPDGSRLGLIRTNPGDEEHSELLVVAVDGTSERRLVTKKVGLACDWSPDGQTILTERNGSLLLVNLNGRVTEIPDEAPGSSVATRAAFSPNGSSIIFSLDLGDQLDIYTMRVDGSDLVQITDSPADEEFGDWGP